MKINRYNAKGMNSSQIAQAHAAAKIAVAQARAYEKNNEHSVGISELLLAAMNECPCADDLLDRVDLETNDIAVWECPHCTCHHYMRKE